MDVEEALKWADENDETDPTSFAHKDYLCMTTLAAEVRRLRSINAELVEALEIAIVNMDEWWREEPVEGCCQSCDRRVKLKAALARAKEMKP